MASNHTIGPQGDVGYAIFSYDKAGNTFNTNCIVNTAPLERIGVSMSMDRGDSYQSAIEVYGYPGNWDTNFRGILIWLGDRELSVPEAPTLAEPMQANEILDDGSQVTAQRVFRVPEDWAGTTMYVNFVYVFEYETTDGPYTDYVIFPITIRTAAIEPENGGLIELASLLDQDSNPIGLGVCRMGSVQTITATFSYSGANPELYLFIPIIRKNMPGVPMWQESNEWVNPIIPQKATQLILSADEDFTGGTAQVVFDAQELRLGTYCIGAIAKLETPAIIPDPAACPIINIELTFNTHAWNTMGFTYDYEFIVTVDPPGGTVIGMDVTVTSGLLRGDPYQHRNNHNFTGMNSLIGSDAVVDNDPASGYFRLHGGVYELRFNTVVMVIDSSSQLCEYRGFWVAVVMDVPPETANLPAFEREHVVNLNGITTDFRSP